MGTPQKLEIKVGLKVLKPAHDVFEAIIDPTQMSHYFISKSSGLMEEGKTVMWQFPEFDVEFPVRVHKIEQDKFVSYYWDDMNGTATLVQILLRPVKENETFVSITERSRDNDEEGITWLQRNTEGWANFLACLKAYLEYGINLRKGAFIMEQMPSKEHAVS